MDETIMIDWQLVIAISQEVGLEVPLPGNIVTSSLNTKDAPKDPYIYCFTGHAVKKCIFVSNFVLKRGH